MVYSRKLKKIIQPRAGRFKNYRLFYFAAIFLGSLLYLHLSSSYLTRLSKKNYLNEADVALELSAESIECDPINRSYVPYSVELDGVRYPTKLQLHMNHSLNFECLNNTQATKLILFWNEFFRFKHFRYGVGKRTPFVDHQCPVSNCELTEDKSRLDEADLVIVHMKNKYKAIPKHRANPDQRWVFFLFESPMNADFSSKNLNGIFNLTTTYRLDSDVYSAYHNSLNFKWQPNDTFDENYDYAAQKPKLAFTLVSNCLAASDRLSYLQELKKYIAVDIYGLCGEKKCAFQSEHDCHKKLSNEYKFYFAFENSFCKDYITEKFFKVVNLDIVPVVMGMGNYSHYVSLKLFQLNFLKIRVGI